MTKFARNLLWIGTGLLAALIGLHFLAPAIALSSDLVWYTLLVGSAISLSLAAAEVCGLNFSKLSLDRIPMVLSGFGLVLILDAGFAGRLSRFWDSPGALPLSCVLFGGTVAYHLFKYRNRARANGP